MPKNSANKIQYPPGCKEITQDLSTDDLVRRMKDVSMAFQQMSQEENNDCYIPLANLLATEPLLNHESRDVRLLVACGIADVFRVYAPNAPYQHPDLIKKIFLFFIQQLKGLQDPKDPTFKRYFYLLENLAWVKSFNICIELDDSQAIFCKLFSLMFKIVNDNHSEKVKNFMLDMLTPLLIESDTVSMKLIEILLWQLIEPKKSQSKQACWLATQILKKTHKTVDTYMVQYFQSAITHGIQENGLGAELSDDEDGLAQAQAQASNQQQQPIKSRNSKNAPNASKSTTQLCELIYESYQVVPNIMTNFLPQLESKIRSSEEKERCEFTKLLARLFSDRHSRLAEVHTELWRSFLGRFRDISVTVRTRCVQYAMHFLVNQPSLRSDITEQLRQRQHDPDENVRYEVVMAIISAAKKGIEFINEDLLSFVKERTLDKKFKIRREALYGMAFLYKQCSFTTGDYEQPADSSSQQQVRVLQWIKNKCMHNYFQTQLEDRLLVERILHMFLVPYSAPLNQRMRILYFFYSTIDAHAARAFNQLLKHQLNVRKQVKDVLDVLKVDKSEEREQNLKEKIQLCAKNLPEAVKAEEYLTKLCKNLELNPALRQHMDIIVNSTSYPQLSDDGTVLSPPSCSTIELSVKEVLKSLGFPVQTNSFYVVVKHLMERIAPVMIDFQGLILLFDYVNDSLLGPGDYDTQMGLNGSSAKRGLQLILALSTVFPAIFYGKHIFSDYLLPFLWKSDNPAVSELVLQILTNIGNSMNYEGCSQEVITSFPWWATDDVIPQIIDKFILKAATTKQAKYAVQCLNAIINDENEKSRIFGQILDSIKQGGFSLDSPYFRIHLVTTGMIATCGGQLFFPKLLRSIIHKCVVQNLLLKDQRLEEEIAAQEESEKQRATAKSDKPAQPATPAADHTISYEFCSEEIKCKIEGIKLMVRWLFGLKLSTLTCSPESLQEETSKYHKSCENTMNLLRSILQTKGDLNDKGRAGTTLEKAHMRLAASVAMLKIVSNDAITQVPTTGPQTELSQQPQIATSSTSPILSPQQWHTLSTQLLDPEEFVRDRFALKLHKGLFSLQLGHEFLAILALAGFYEPTHAFRAKLRSYLIHSFVKRRDAAKAKHISNLKSIYPECVMPYVIHLISHQPFYTQYDDMTQLEIVKNCLWFIMEPLVLKNEQFSFSFFKRTFENIKTCVDKVSAASSASATPENGQPEQTGSSLTIATMTNYKIYCACDLALGLVMSKTQNFLLKEYPVQPSLPPKYYMVSPLAKDNNLKSYLPAEMHFAPPKRCGLETEILGKMAKAGPGQGQGQATNGSATNNGTRRSSRTAPTSSGDSAPAQIVVLTTSDSNDGSVIEADSPQVLTISSDQLVRVVDGSVVQDQGQQGQQGQPATITINSVPNTAVVIASATNSSTHVRSRKQNLSNVVLTDENGRDPVLGQEENGAGQQAKRTRLESSSSARNGKTGEEVEEVEEEDGEDGEDGEEEENKQASDDEEESASAQQPAKPRRGRPPKAATQPKATEVAAAAATATAVAVPESPESSNVRKSSRISLKRPLSPAPEPEPAKERVSTGQRGRPRIRR